MTVKERDNLILIYLREHREASIAELCSALYVSEPTIRRDLRRLSLLGKIIRTHGGALHKSELGENLPLSMREKENANGKAQIGKKCLELIKDGDVIMVDGSSTALALLEAFPENKSAVVVTNSAKAPFILSKKPVRTFVTGGELASDTYVYVGSYAENFLRSFNADVCFFSVRSLSADGRLTDNAIAENSLRRIMMEKSKKRVLMLDSEKLGEPCMNTLATLDEVDFVVCESDISNCFSEFKSKFI